MGLGLILTLALGVLGILFREKVLSILEVLSGYLPNTKKLIPLFLCGILMFLNATCCLATPTVSLEGKNIWIPKTMPISALTILQSKLLFHLIPVVPVMALCALCLGIAYGLSITALVLSVLVVSLAACFNATLGLWAGLRWARLDYISEAHPCKQSAAILVSMLSLMGLPVALGLGYWVLESMVSPTLYMALAATLLSGGSLGFYRIVTTWGVKHWESL